MMHKLFSAIVLVAVVASMLGCANEAAPKPKPAPPPSDNTTDDI